jgi:BlaI family transcriptional regulator, penicillinase repressor
MAEAEQLSRRERQIMDIVYAHGQATASQVLRELADPPTRTAVRTFLRILEEKGHLSHEKSGREFVFRPTHPRASAGKSALRRLLDVFFDGSIERAVAAHLSSPDASLTADEIKRLSQLIRQARRKKGRS